jgi:hypothetical protein
MVSLINQYSLFAAVVLFLILVGFALFRKAPRLPEIIAFLAIVAGLAVAWLVLRPTQSPLTGSAEEVRAKIGAGKAVLMEFQSPY